MTVSMWHFCGTGCREEVDRIAEKKGIDFDKADTSSTFGSKVPGSGALFHAAGSGCGAAHGSGHVRRRGGAHGARTGDPDTVQ